MGSKSGDEVWDAALNFYEAAKARSGSARVHYAWGLVCLRHGRCQEGAEQFRLATRSDDAFYPPAWQTLACGQVANQEYVPACKRSSSLQNA